MSLPYEVMYNIIKFRATTAKELLAFRLVSKIMKEIVDVHCGYCFRHFGIEEMIACSPYTYKLISTPITEELSQSLTCLVDNPTGPKYVQDMISVCVIKNIFSIDFAVLYRHSKSKLELVKHCFGGGRLISPEEIASRSFYGDTSIDDINALIYIAQNTTKEKFANYLDCMSPYSHVISGVLFGTNPYDTCYIDEANVNVFIHNGFYPTSEYLEKYRAIFYRVKSYYTNHGARKSHKWFDQLDYNPSAGYCYIGGDPYVITSNEKTINMLEKEDSPQEENQSDNFRKFLEEHRDMIAACGGVCAGSCAMSFINEKLSPGDIDLWFDDKELYEVFLYEMKKIDVRSMSFKTLYTNDDSHIVDITEHVYNGYRIQTILLNIDKFKYINESFDIRACTIIWDPSLPGEELSRSNPKAIEDIRTMKTVYRESLERGKMVGRVNKYRKKGFDVIVGYRSVFDS